MPSTTVDLTEPIVKRLCLNKSSNRNVNKNSSSSITENKSDLNSAIEISDDDSSSSSVEIISNNSDEVEKNKNLSRKKRNKKKRFGKEDNKTGQSSNKPISFDYAKIDYNKYKGGSQQLQKGNNEFRTKFHGKVIKSGVVWICWHNKFYINIHTIYFEIIELIIFSLLFHRVKEIKGTIKNLISYLHFLTIRIRRSLSKFNYYERK